MKEKQENKINKVILIGSGKGGVGKSTITVNLAVSFSKKGYQVGLLDADLHGPSIAKMMSLEGSKITSLDGKTINPIKKFGINVISMAFLLENQDHPVIWRGPIKATAIRQFIEEVNWGKLDFLLIDLPPGTGDEPLSVTQSIKNPSGFIIVTTPQDIALLDSRKTINFAKKLQIPILGIIENMSGFICPHCHERIEIFKQGGGKKAASDFSVPFLGAIPLDLSFVESGDNGFPLVLKESKESEIFKDIVEKMVHS